MRRGDWVRSFTVRLALAYLVLVIPWPGVDRAFSSLYRGTTNAVIGAVGLGEYLHLQSPKIPLPRGDVELAITKPSVGRLRIEHGSRDWGYLPLAAGLALILAIPSPWPKRVRSGCILMVLIVFFVLGRVGIASVYGLCQVQVLMWEPSTVKALGSLMMGFSATPVASFVVPVILWFLVLYRSFDLRVLSNETAPPDVRSVAGSDH